MDISRISKAIADVRGDQRFQDAEGVRNIEADVLLPDQPSETVRLMAQTAIALLLRCFTGKIRIHSRNADPLVRASCEFEASKMGKPNRLDFDARELGPCRLALGCRADGAICADASGWTARVNGVFEERAPAAAPAITFAVSCAVAKLFNMAIFANTNQAFEAWDFCLLRFLSGDHVLTMASPQADIGRVGLLGAGAIGSAVGYVLSLSGWTGRLEIIDFDTFQWPNLETCIAADIVSVNRPLRKADGLAAIFKGHGITVVSRHCQVKGGEAILTERWDAFICAVDNAETRQVLDLINTMQLLNAGLGANKEDAGWVLWTRHGPGDPTLSSIYTGTSDGGSTAGDHVPEEFREECSRQHYRGVSLALPFVGLAAGSLLVSNLYQQATGARLGHRRMEIDLFAKQQKLSLS